MEKRERQERYRHNQASKKRFATRKPPNDGINVSQNSKEKKNTPPPNAEEKKVVDHTAIPDPHMFDNLKRETDDIAALTTKTHTKRQIFSNWAKYESVPTDNEQDNQRIGEDFETLLQGAQIGSHFQLRSECSWDPKRLPTQSVEFAIDLGVLVASLACLPLYHKLDLPKEVFSKKELEDMELNAKRSCELTPQLIKQQGKGLENESLSLYKSHLDCLSDWSHSVEPQLSSVDQFSTRNKETKEEHHEKSVEAEDFHFGTPPPAKVPVTSATQQKERATPPRTDFVQRSPLPKPVEDTPAEFEAQDEAFVESNPLPPRGRKKNPPDEAAAEAAAVVEGEVLPKEMTSQEISAQESLGKKKSRGGKNKTNKRRSLEQDKGDDAQPPKDESNVSREDPRIQLTTQSNYKNLTPPKEVEDTVIHETLQSKQQSILTEKVDISKVSDTPVKEQKPKNKEELKLSQLNVDPANQTVSVPVEKTARESEERNDEMKNVTSKKDNELDELLSLRKPVTSEQTINFAVPTSAVKASIDEEDTSPISKPVAAEKKEDLEDWLDSMLDD